MRPLVDEIVDPADPPSIVLKCLEDDALHASSMRRLATGEVKYIAKMVLQALRVLHENGFVHTGKKGLSKWRNMLNAHNFRYQAQ